MELSQTALVLIGLLMAAWTIGAGWLMVVAAAKMRSAAGSRKAARRMARMIDEAPAIPLIVRTDGRIEGSERLAAWLGLDHLPAYLSELDGSDNTDRGLSAEQLVELTENVRRTQKTAAPFRMALTPPGSQRSLAVRGLLADPQVSPGGSALVWVFDFSESESELSRLREEAARAKGDFGALVGIIEAAPMPMWFRGPDTKLQLVNRAYVDAIAAESADIAVKNGIELIEPVDGLSAAQIAGQAFERRQPIERVVATTIDGQRRAMRVSDLPLGKEGIAGYAVDIEQMEEQGRQFRAFRDVQRAILDQLSIGVGQFDGSRKLAFANQPFRRIFALQAGFGTQNLEFERFLSGARDAGKTPEVRDFPEWRKEHENWFAADEAQEEAWPLFDGTHLRVVAQPMPDGGLVIIAEDRTEQLALSATRDTLLRTRTAMFDSLFEALAVFSPDGRLQLWNRSFAGTWGLDPDKLEGHPTASDVLAAIASQLRKPKQIAAVEEAIRSATLDRAGKGGRLTLANDKTLEFAGIPLPDGNGLLTALDISDSQKAEDSLRDRNKALEAADEVKTRFLSNMSYEFRTPLTSIGGFAELLQAGVAGDLNEQGQEYVEAILQAVGRLTDQVENVLDLSQSEAGLLPLNKKSVEMLAFATEIVRSREAAIEKAELTLDLRGSRATGKIEADPRQLGKAIGLLLDNAIAATAKGGRIVVDLSKAKNTARIAISDNGSGMSEASLKNVLDGEIDDKKQGLGIPLAIRLVESHGGTMEIKSVEGRGTAVIIRIPGT
ncbi:MAG: PAS-domain containing protein [Pontixanthobacter sp.]